MATDLEVDVDLDAHERRLTDCLTICRSVSDCGRVAYINPHDDTICGVAVGLCCCFFEVQLFGTILLVVLR